MQSINLQTVQRLAHILADILCCFDSNGKPQQVRCDGKRFPFGFIKADILTGIRVYDQRLAVTEISQMIDQLQVIDKFETGLLIFQPKG